MGAQRLFAALVSCALAAFAAGLALWPGGPGTPAAAAHVVLACGAMPLVLAGMGYFVPVLTRTGPAPAWVLLLPPSALAAGVMAALAFAGGAAAPWLFVAGAGLAQLCALAMSLWIAWRAQAAVGAPHPCLWWYLAACACLAVALSAVLLLHDLPGQRQALRLFHLHLNTLGFVGLTALATLHVLLPTAAGQADPEAARALARGLLPALAGVAGIAAGAAWWPPLAWVAWLLWLIPVLALLVRAATRLRRQVLRRDGAAPALAAALAGLLLTGLAGLGAGAGLRWAGGVVLPFALGFLLPLVTGAATQLLPVLLAGTDRARRQGLARRLGLFAAPLALLLLAAGAAAVAAPAVGVALGLAGLALFAAKAAWAVLSSA